MRLQSVGFPRGWLAWSGLSIIVTVPAWMGIAAVANGGANAAPPPIRIIAGSADGQVPACVTPERLMTFLAVRNTSLDPRYAQLAKLYKQHGETWRVRWDYAFYQMVIETNYLMFRRGDGKSGDVNPKQYNFAGLGTTGGGVPGDAYPDPSTGVLAQIQHLVVYSGERIDRPIGSRTQLRQDDIISASAAVSRRRPVTFQDLSGRWASDRSYGRMIESVAERYRAMFCTGREALAVAEPPRQVQPPAPLPAMREAQRPQAALAPADAKSPQVRIASVRPATAGVGLTAPRPVPVADAGNTAGCTVQAASFGGRKAVLIRATVDGRSQLTALQVLDGFEASMIENFTRSFAKGGAPVGEFASQQAAIDHARRICQAEADTGIRQR